MKKILILFLVLITVNIIVAQPPLPNDCSRAITVCGNGTFFSNASGIGTIQEVTGCLSSEHNSLWMRIVIAPTVAPNSTLGFNLIPDDPSVAVDYDFWVFGPNTACGTL